MFDSMLTTATALRDDRERAYLPIADHGVIGDLHSAALVAADGTIDWLCLPAFDSPSVFASILDADRGGHFRVAPRGEFRTKQLYVPDTNVLVTRFLSPTGVAEVQDFMALDTDDNGPHRQRLIRRIACIRGELTFTVDCTPSFDYGRMPHDVQLYPGAVVFSTSELTLSLSTPATLLRTANGGVRGAITLAAGETATFVLERLEAGGQPVWVTEQEADEAYARTVDYWLDWVGQSTYTGRWREMVNRSALALKLLTYRPTGAMVAAATASLPESLGGPRNWDYRYAWVRDSAFSLHALMRLGFNDEALAFGAFMRECVRRTAERGGDPLRLMYGIDGRLDLPEETLDHFEGYRGSAPVRIGNGATDQLQLDIYGELLDAAYLMEQRGAWQMPYDAWVAVHDMVEWLCEHWRQPDEGIWETRGGKRQFTHSRLMSWVALDRAVRIARNRGLPADIGRWASTRDDIHRALMTGSWSESRQAFVQYEGGDVLDASVLLMPMVGFVSPTDPRWLSTLDAITHELVSDSLVYRYDPEASPDGLDGDEGTFSMCSFWYVESLARAGRVDEARLAFEKMLTYANHVGLYSEQIGPGGDLLGNFPQAFTHLGLINAALLLDRELEAAGPRRSRRG